MRKWLLVSMLAVGCGGAPAEELDPGLPEEVVREYAPSSLTFEEQVLALINERRAQGGSCGSKAFAPAPALVLNETLREAARLHSQDMGRSKYFSHTSLDGRTFEQRLRAAGYAGGNPWGENIAAGQSSPAAVMKSWMGSTGHCSNILNPAYRGVGIGYASVSGSPYTHYWTQDFGGGP